MLRLMHLANFIALAIIHNNRKGVTVCLKKSAYY